MELHGDARYGNHLGELETVVLQAGMYEAVNNVYKLVLPIYEANRVFKMLAVDRGKHKKRQRTVQGWWNSTLEGFGGEPPVYAKWIQTKGDKFKGENEEWEKKHVFRLG